MLYTLATAGLIASASALTVAPRAGPVAMSAKTVTPLPASVKPGVVTGEALWDLLQHAKTNGYAIPVILHTDHCMRSWLPWFDGLLEANEAYFAKNGEPLFSSHMLDLSEEPLFSSPMLDLS